MSRIKGLLVGVAALGALAQPATAPASVDVAYSDETGRISFIGATRADALPVPGPDGLPLSEARRFLESRSAALGLSDPATGLRPAGVVPAAQGGTAVRLDQTIDGVPVLGGEFVVSLTRAGEVLSVSGEAEPATDVQTEPALGAGLAVQAALARVSSSEGLAASELTAGPPALRIFDSRLLGGPGADRPVLVWQVEVSAPLGDPIRELVLVSAQDGRVVLAIDQVAHGRDRRICDRENTRITPDMAKPYCTTPVRSEGQGAVAGRDQVNAAYTYAGAFYDFISSRFGRDSIDGEGMPLRVNLRSCGDTGACPTGNAYWNGVETVYGDGWATDDLVGHEFAHGLTEHTSGLFYYMQSGAINESMSDVFGEFIDKTDGTNQSGWFIGEDLPSGAIRNMKTPGAYNQPDRMTSPLYEAHPSWDEGGVHVNSGVGNKAAFLIAEGATFNGRTVTGIGIDKAARIYYAVQSTLLTSASDYADLGNALPQACVSLIGTGAAPNTITADDCAQVNRAVAATEMGTEAPAAPAPEAPTCNSGGAPQTFFLDDMEDSGSSAKWTFSFFNTANVWNYDTFYEAGGEWHLRGYAAGSTTDSALEGPFISVPASLPAGGAFLRLRHSYNFVSGDVLDRDGAVLEYTTNTGFFPTWHDAGPLFTHNGYPATLAAAGTNPLAGRQAFTGTSRGYISSRLSLAAFAGQAVRFRLRIGTDDANGSMGWAVDDFRAYTCTADSSRPETTFTGGPGQASYIRTQRPTFSFAAGEAESTFTCSVDGAAPSPCRSPEMTDQLADGPHSMSVTATDPAGNADLTPASRSFTVDTIAPDTGISGPSGLTGDSTPTFTFSATDSSPSTFACRLDGSPVGCISGSPLAALGEGSHTLAVTATDAAGNVDPTPATRTVVVDTTPPDTTILSGPTGPTKDSTPSFTFSVADANAATLRCSVDGVEVGECADSRTVGPLDDGPHTFSVVATDAAGNAEPAAAARSFVVDTVAPVTSVTAGPDGPTADDTPAFAFSAVDATAVTFTCGVDGGAAAACTSGDTLGPLAQGPHSFAVYATDAAGNVEAGGAQRSFSIDSVAPDTAFTLAPAPGAVVSTRTPRFEFSATEPGSAFTCRLDGGAPFSCTSPFTTSSLADGAHSFEAWAADSLGNADLTPATLAFTVRTAVVTPSPPQTRLVRAGIQPSRRKATFWFSATGGAGALAFDCRLDAKAWTRCTSPRRYANLKPGRHVFAVRAVDSQGRVDESPAQRAFRAQRRR